MHKKTHFLFSIALTALIVAAPHPSLAENKGGGGFDPGGYKGGGGGGVPNNNGGPGYNPDPNLAVQQFYTYAGVAPDGNTKDIANAATTYKGYADAAADIKMFSKTGASEAINALNNMPGVKFTVAGISTATDTMNLGNDLGNASVNPNLVDIASGIGNAMKVGVGAIVVYGETLALVGAGTANAPLAVTGGGITITAGGASLIMSLAGTIGTLGGALYADFIDNRGNHYIVPVEQNNYGNQWGGYNYANDGPKQGNNSNQGRSSNGQMNGGYNYSNTGINGNRSSGGR